MVQCCREAFGSEMTSSQSGPRPIMIASCPRRRTASWPWYFRRSVTGAAAGPAPDHDRARPGAAHGLLAVVLRARRPGRGLARAAGADRLGDVRALAPDDLEDRPSPRLAADLDGVQRPRPVADEPAE